MSYVVAVDGASGTGKGTVTRYVAEKLGLVTIDTGALYRSVTLEALNKGVALPLIQFVSLRYLNLYKDL